MRRRVGVAALLAAWLLLLSGPAAADGFGGAYVEDATPTAEAGVTLTSGGQQPDGGGGSSGAARCVSEPARLAPGEVPLDADGSPRVATGPGAWQVRRCFGPDGQETSFDVVFAPAGVPVDPLVLAQQARQRLPLGSPVVATSPNSDQMQLVGVPTWLWVAVGWAAQSASASVPGVSVTVTAEPVRVTWVTGDGRQVVCAGPGRPFDPQLPEAAQSTDCSHTYTRSSAGQPGDQFAVTATITWRVSWSAAGVAGGGELGEVERSATVPLRVAEGQALVGAGG